MKGQRTDLDQSNKGILDRIKSNCEINEKDCWIWLGHTNNKDRPVCSVKNETGLSYRHAYEAYYNKKISSKVYLCHTCDSSMCCNPEHLFEGDNRLNQLDYIAKNVSIKNGYNSGLTYVNTGLKRANTTCPSSLNGLDRVNWYKQNAIREDKYGCWIWQREIGKDGYGRIKYKGKKFATHRLFWGLYYNKIDELDSLREKGLVFRHTCNNKSCCNPKHIKPGTRSENALDSAIRKFNEPVEEWLALYEIVLNEGCNISRIKVVKGLRDLGLVSEEVSDTYVVNVLRGKSHKHIHREFFDWTPNWK